MHREQRFNPNRKENSMKAVTRVMCAHLYLLPVLACACASSRGIGDHDKAGHPLAAPAGTQAAPYANMPTIAPIGVRINKYLDVPDVAKGPRSIRRRATERRSWVTVST
jgi:hypothetical protein